VSTAYRKETSCSIRTLIAAELETFLGLGLPMTATARHIFVAGDIARRGPDGYWRYIIDNPYGTTVRR
jgi:hypothetical protein